MYNVDLRNAIRKAGFFNYEIASCLGMTETSFSRKMARQEFTDEEKRSVMQAVQKMAERRVHDG